MLFQREITFVSPRVRRVLATCLPLLVGPGIPVGGCGGTSYVCADASLCLYDDEDACEAHTGCTWSNHCVRRGCGDAAATQSDCAARPGCSWQAAATPMCAQAPNVADCAPLVDAGACATLSHCTWNTACEINPATSCSSAHSSPECDKIGHCKWTKTGGFTLG